MLISSGQVDGLARFILAQAPKRGGSHPGRATIGRRLVSAVNVWPARTLGGEPSGGVATTVLVAAIHVAARARICSSSVGVAAPPWSRAVLAPLSNAPCENQEGSDDCHQPQRVAPTKRCLGVRVLRTKLGRQRTEHRMKLGRQRTEHVLREGDA